MFKIEVDANGTIHHHYWMNKHEDDFLRFLPAQFTRMHGEEILPEHLTIYKIAEAKKDLLEGKMGQSEANELKYKVGKILVCRCEVAHFKVGDKVPLDIYEELRLDRDKKFKGSKDQDKLKTKKPASKLEDYQGKEVEVVTIKATDDLAIDAESLELELEGVQLVKWPYKKNEKKVKGKKEFVHFGGVEFLGNK